ncbi:unnamed protein product [Blepharisma stoltei]|uniref:PUM-HD domain-containing protein n=1 Tax=Blepharisma stoltei TaxID=1481888 RepID=A0AAU9JBD9_9CILI|nr:unnamed protein product [Blepharisma stoltei]
MYDELYYDQLHSAKALSTSNLFSYSISSVYSSAFSLTSDFNDCTEKDLKLLYTKPKPSINHKPSLFSEDICLAHDNFLENSNSFQEKSQIENILNKASPNLYKISQTKNGTRWIQKLITAVSQNSLYIEIIANSLKSHVIELSKDLNGNYVIQKCLSTFSPIKNQIIFDEINENLIEISINKHGCCVVQRCIDAALPYQLENLVGNIIKHTTFLINDPFGNYVLQYVISLGKPDINSKLAMIFLKDIKNYASQKYSSNVIEKCLQANTPETQQIIIKEISKPENFEKMIFDQYANYGNYYIVIQRALSIAEPELLSQMLYSIKTLMGKLKHSKYGRRICSKLLESHPNLNK